MLELNSGYDECQSQIKILDEKKMTGAVLKSIGQRTRKRNVKQTIVDISDLDQKERELLLSLDDFFTEEMIKDIIIPIKQQHWNISLRTLDYLLTTYAKPHNVQYRRTQDEHFPWNLYKSYKSMLLNSGPKKKFDPFCRGNRIVYKKGNTEVKTTLGQLNFFRWAIKNEVLKWAVDHAEEIQADIDKNSKKTRKLKNSKVSAKKRQKL